MQFETGRKHRDDETAVLPLINIVFLLLAFFIIAGQLTPLPPFEVDPPTVSSEPVKTPPPVTVHIARDGALAIDSQLATAERIEQRLATMTGAPSAPRVRIVADGQADANTVVALMQRMRAAGVEAAELTTRQP